MAQAKRHDRPSPPTARMTSQKILILMSNTGGGHRASAEALQAGFARRFGDRFQVEIIDLLIDHLPWPLNQLPKSYALLANYLPWLWRLLWKTGERQIIASPLMTLAARWAAPSIRRVLQTYEPDLIISVHPLVQEMTLYALNQEGRQRPYVIVVTDLSTAHPLWFHPDARLCFVASEEARRRALRAGMRPEQLRQFGLPIRPAFAETPRARTVLRRELGMDPELPAALLLGGGEGIGPVARIARCVAEGLHGQGTPIGQLVIVCGRNRILLTRLKNRRWPVPTIVNGFVHNMSDWMAACDCVITKAGPGTIAEAMIRGLPVILSGFIPGQEEGNIPYVVDNRVGAFSTDPAEIARLVTRWFGEEREELAAMSARARELGNPRSTLQIVEEIANVLDG